MLELPLMVGLRLFYATGIAAVAAHRYELLPRLFTHDVVTGGRRPGSASDALRWDTRHNYIDDQQDTAAMRAGLATALGEALGLSRARLDVVWQEFETLRTAAQILTAGNAAVRIDEVRQTDIDLASARDRVTIEGAAAQPAHNGGGNGQHDHGGRIPLDQPSRPPDGRTT